MAFVLEIRTTTLLLTMDIVEDGYLPGGAARREQWRLVVLLDELLIDLLLLVREYRKTKVFRERLRRIFLFLLLFRYRVCIINSC